jgi:uncharacterized protein
MSVVERDARQASGMLAAAPHHRFEIDGIRYLFGTESLRVLREDACMRETMRCAASGIAPNVLMAALAARGFDAETSEDRVAQLRACGFLLERGRAPPALDAEQGGCVTFMVNVSQRCNLTCSYCYVNQGLFDYEEKPVKKMRREIFETVVPRVFRMFPDSESYAFHFYGGEPLMNFTAIREISEAALAQAQARGAGVQFYVTTNGTLITGEIADFFDRLRFNVYLSVDGERASHDEYRKYRDGRGSFDDVMASFALLRSRPHVHLIGSSVVRDGFSLGEAIQFLAQHGADTCKAERVRLAEGAAGALTETQRERYLRDIRDLIAHYIEAISQGRTAMDYRLRPKILQLLLRRRRAFFCAAGERMFGIAANGEIYPCALHVGRRQAKLGSLDDGIDGELARSFRRKYAAETQPRCGTCWAHNLCGGGCSAMVDRFGHEDCEALRAETEAAIVVFEHFASHDPMQLLALVSPALVAWMNGPGEEASRGPPR